MSIGFIEYNISAVIDGLREAKEERDVCYWTGIADMLEECMRDEMDEEDVTRYVDDMNEAIEDALNKHHLNSWYRNRPE